MNPESTIGNLAVKTAIYNGYVTADDLHQAQYEGDRRLHGIVLKGLTMKGVLKPNGYISSNRKACHGRPIIKYVMA